MGRRVVMAAVFGVGALIAASGAMPQTAHGGPRLQAARIAAPSNADPSKGSLNWTKNNLAVCVTMVRDIAPAQAVRLLLGKDRNRLHGRSQADKWIDHGGYRYWVGVGTRGRWTFLWEDNGYNGSLRHVAKRLSASSSMVSFFWNVNEVTQFTYAVRGRIVRSFDPVLDSRNGGTGTPLPAEQGVHWRRHPINGMVRLQSKITTRPPAHPRWLKRHDVRFWGSHG